MPLEKPKDNPHFESPEENEALRLRNAMQIELIKRFARRTGITDRQVAAKRWISSDRHYSRIFSDLIEATPELLSRYRTESEAVLLEIEALLYADEDQRLAA